MQQSDLFNKQPTKPWAELLRPSKIDEVVGQEHLLAVGKSLQVAFASGIPHSMIFWGPPGVGKTTLARLTAQVFDCEFIALSAVFSGVKDIRQAVELAQQYLQQDKRTILFVDEIHRFNKAQQDALLPYVESGLVVFIGATTENPSFEVNAALLSRAQVYVLKPLQEADLLKIVAKAHKLAMFTVNCTDEIKQLLVSYADGDARRMCNLLEQIQNAATAQNINVLTEEFVANSLTRASKLFDKNGEQFYELISAFHKSVRGSDPNASLYWLARMLESGVDPQYLVRRIVRIAWEDIGLADPRAMQVANDAAISYERLGSPEGELALAQATIYLAVAAKSNAGYVAYNQVREYVKNNPSLPVPIHLRNAPTKFMHDLGYGANYRYAHDEPYAYAAGENYFPEGMEHNNWYRPTERGLEQKIQQKMRFLKQLDENSNN